QAVLYVPGLTGLLYAPNGQLAGERWVTGEDIVTAVEGVDVPSMIASYVHAVAAGVARRATEPPSTPARHQTLTGGPGGAPHATAERSGSSTPTRCRPTRPPTKRWRPATSSPTSPTAPVASAQHEHAPRLKTPPRLGASLPGRRRPHRTTAP